MMDRSEINEWLESLDRVTYEAQWDDALPARFATAALPDLPQELERAVGRWCVSVADEGHAGNLILFGPTGTGKTHAAVAAARALGQPPSFWPVVELLDGLRPGGDVNPDALTQGLLILDDLGAERPSDWTAERLYALVNRRWLELEPTIVTTNADPEGWPTLFGARLCSRLVDGATALRLTGPDRRRPA